MAMKRYSLAFAVILVLSLAAIIYSAQKTIDDVGTLTTPKAMMGAIDDNFTELYGKWTSLGTTHDTSAELDALYEAELNNSAGLAAALSDETGTGAAVFANSPTLVTPALGTPASGNLANCTFPTLNQNTSGTAAGLSGVSALPDGTTATTQSGSDNSTKVATTAYVDGAVGAAGGGNVSKVGTPADHEFGIWTGDGTIAGVAVTGSKVVCTDADGEPVACTNLTDVAIPTGSAASRDAEDTLTDGSNLPDGAAIKAYGDSNWGAGEATTYAVLNSNGGVDEDLSDGATASTVPSSAAVVAELGTKVEIADPDADAFMGWNDTSGEPDVILPDGATIEIYDDSGTLKARVKDSGISTAKLASPTGTDTNVVTGTDGDSGDIVVWDANGDAIGSGQSPAELEAAARVLDDNESVTIDATPDGMADGAYNGITIGGINHGETVGAIKCVFLASDGKVDIADADAAGEFPAIGLTVNGGDDTDPAVILVRGVVRDEDWTGLTVGGFVYLGDDGTGQITQTAPSTSGDCVQIVGWALSDSEIYFDFSRPYQEVE
jgi:hypothetical protein